MLTSRVVVVVVGVPSAALSAKMHAEMTKRRMTMEPVGIAASPAGKTKA